MTTNADAAGPLDRGVRRRGNTLKGFVLVTPRGDVMAETFRSTRDAAKGWMSMLKMGDGRYHDWKHYYRQGWRCKPASMTLDEPSNL